MTASSSHTQWETAPLADLIGFIETHYHAALRRELPQLIALADRVEREHHAHAACPHGLRALLEAMHPVVLDHLVKEERVLFPMILEGYGPRAGGPVRVMEIEHDEHLTNLAHIHELTHNLTSPLGASPMWVRLYADLKRFEAQFLEHIALENNVLFPRAITEG